jgi:hypothetical protein
VLLEAWERLRTDETVQRVNDATETRSRYASRTELIAHLSVQPVSSPRYERGTPQMQASNPSAMTNFFLDTRRRNLCRLMCHSNSLSLSLSLSLSHTHTHTHTHTQSTSGHMWAQCQVSRGGRQKTKERPVIISQVVATFKTFRCQSTQVCSVGVLRPREGQMSKWH